MNLFHLIGSYFWVLSLLIALVNCALSERRLRASTRLDEARKTLARHYLRRFWGAATLPWLVMGWGQVIGRVPSAFSYFRPQDGDPYVLAWFASIFLLAVLFAAWVLLAGGARTISELGLLSFVRRRRPRTDGQPTPEWQIKLYAGLMPVWIVGWVLMTTHMNVAILK